MDTIDPYQAAARTVAVSADKLRAEVERTGLTLPQTTALAASGLLHIVPNGRPPRPLRPLGITWFEYEHPSSWGLA